MATAPATTMQHSTANESNALVGSAVNATNGGSADPVTFAQGMAKLHSSSFKARRAALGRSVPVTSTSKGSPTKSVTLKANFAHAPSSEHASPPTSQLPFTNITPERIGKWYILLKAVAVQISYMIFAGTGFLLTTWARCILVIPNIIFQPVNFFSMLLFAFGASAMLFVAAGFALLGFLPIVGPLIQKMVDYVMVGPYGPGGVRSAVYYKEFPEELKASALNVLSSPAEPDFETKTNSEEPRTIYLDVTRYFSALCALVYLRDSKKYAESLVEEVPSIGDCPEYDWAIRDIARDHLQLEYVALCELPSRHASPQRPSTASVGLFYSKTNPTFIILAFKGTTPTSFPDWLVDFTFPYLPANAELDAYGSVHEGFYRALFPRDVRAWADVAEDGPWDLMRKGIRETVCELDKLQPEGGKRDVNVWVTGHSLGAVLAQMFFAKALQSEDEWVVKVGEAERGSSNANGGEKKGRYAKAILRDSYTFGTPIFGDVFSRGSFNNALFAPKKGRRHDVWRFVNHADIVATGLPDLGDQSYSKGWLPAAISTASDTGGLGGLNQFTFTHVGEEVTLKGGSDSYVGPGTLWPWGTKIVIKGGTDQRDPYRVRPYLASVPKWLVALQHVPLFGRILAHSPILYAYQLEQCSAAAADGEGEALTWATDFWWSPAVDRFFVR